MEYQKFYSLHHKIAENTILENGYVNLMNGNIQQIEEGQVMYNDVMRQVRYMWLKLDRAAAATYY